MRENCKSQMHTLMYIYIIDRMEADPSARAHTHKTYLTKLFISQKKMIRIITFSDYYAHTNPLFTKLKLLKLCEIYSYFMCICIYKYINSQLPSNIFDAFFTLTTSIHDYKTRHHSDLLFITPKLHPFVFVFKGQKYGISK